MPYDIFRLSFEETSSYNDKRKISYGIRKMKMSRIFSLVAQQSTRHHHTLQMLKPVAGFFDLAVNLRDKIGE